MNVLAWDYPCQSLKNMNPNTIILPRRSAVKKHDVRLIFTIAISWTIVDFILFLIRLTTDTFTPKYASTNTGTVKAILLRELNVFIISLIMGYFLVSVFKNFLRHISPGLNLFLKTLLLLTVITFMNFFIYFTFGLAFGHQSASEAFTKFLENTFRKQWLLQKLPEWILLFVLTQLALEINENFSQGVFFNIIIGKYLRPREENRIIMFIDLKNSTPIAEKLGHKEYFKFIRDVIYCISAGVAEHNGRVYQYVGDEIVAWWPSSPLNARKSVNAIIESRKILNKNAEIFKRGFDILPEYKIGIHTGNITVGQIGTTKKDIVMSGDTINTAARIRSACTELNQKFVVSKEFIELLNMKDWQSESLGMVDLKGKNESIELFALKI
jgi:adenylate cyclase